MPRRTGIAATPIVEQRVNAVKRERLIEIGVMDPSTETPAKKKSRP